MNLRKLTIVVLVFVLVLPMARAQVVQKGGHGSAQDRLARLAAAKAKKKKASDKRAREIKQRLEKVERARRRRVAFEKAKAKAQARRKLWGDFREVTWGSPIVKYPAMALAEDKGEWKFYRQKKNDLVIGAAKVNQITYGFYNDQFYSVMIEVSGEMNMRALKDAVFATYGKGHRKNKTAHEWAWRSGREAPKYVSMALKYGDDRKGANLILTYAPNKKKTAVDRKKAAKAAARDF